MILGCLATVATIALLPTVAGCSGAVTETTGFSLESKPLGCALHKW